MFIFSGCTFHAGDMSLTYSMDMWRELSDHFAFHFATLIAFGCDSQGGSHAR
jgi:hypothetical protein